MLALAALAAVFLPVIGGKRVAGSAAGVPIPTVGECLTGVLAVGGQGNIVLDDGQPQTSTSRGTPGDCTAVDAARVIAVRVGVDLPRVMSLREMFTESEADCGPALAALADKVGATGRIWRRAGRQIGIRTDAIPSAQLVGPTEDDPAGHWVACVAVDPDGIPTAVELTGPEMARIYGRCFFSTTSEPGTRDEMSEICGRSHNVEQIGSVYLTTGATTADDYQAACRQFAVTATGMTDPTAGGQLRVEAVDDGSWSGAAASCRVSVADPTRTLSGSLLGIGSAPLPWSP